MNICFIIFALFLIGGGIIGFKKAGSKPSLIAGTSSGLLILLSLFIAQNNENVGYGFIAFICVQLIVAFSIRLKKTKKFMPSGLLLCLGVAALILSLSVLIN